MSHELHHFTMGLWVLFLAYGASVVGSYVGLSCARQLAKLPPGNARRGWLWMAALSIGGVGIWLTHFIAMMGFAVPGTMIRYDPVLTAVSVVVAVLATAFGLWIVDLRSISGQRLPRLLTLIIGGVLMGLAVSFMHYTGMAAIRIQGTIDHQPGFVAGSVVIGIVAATAALWLARVAESALMRVAGGLIMGCAVAALHYTGMAGVEATVDPSSPAPDGYTVMALLLPAYFIGTAVLVVPVVKLLLAPQAAEAHLDDASAVWAARSTTDTFGAVRARSSDTEMSLHPTHESEDTGRYIDASVYTPRVSGR